MKIFYSAGPYLDAGEQFLRFSNVNKSHQLKIASYIKSSTMFSHIDWTLDALYNKAEIKNSSKICKLFGHRGVTRTVAYHTESLLKDITDYEPDLIISNAEPVSAHIAKALSVKLWYCSPLHLLDGIVWDHNVLRYFSLLESTKKFLSTLPQSDKTFIYSPFGDLINPPQLKAGYEWIQPYWTKTNKIKQSKINTAVLTSKDRSDLLKKILNGVSFDVKLYSQIEDYKQMLADTNWFFMLGDTSYLADALYNAITRVCIAPSLNEPESLLNAIFCKSYGFGDDLAQVELLDKYAIAEIEKSQSKQLNLKYIDKITMPTLDEKIREIKI
jgi:hypothetical protein